MRALVLNKAEDFVYEDRPRPVPGPGDVLVKISAVCICGSDVHVIKGDPTSYSLPGVIGHEVAGVVVETAPDVKDLAVGDTVCLMPCISCGSCKACRKGNTNSCTTLKLYGVHRDGGMQEYLCTPSRYWLKVPFPAAPAEVSMIEPLTIGAHAVAKLGLGQEDRVLVIGAGPIGMSCAVNARSYGATVVMSEINDGRRAFARERFGIEILNPLAEDYPAEVDRLTNGELFDAVIDTTAVKASMDNAWKMLAQGGRLLYVGILRGTLEINEQAFHMKEPVLYVTRNSTRTDYERVLSLWENGKIDPSLFITHTAPFDKAGKTLVKWVHNPAEVFKGVITFD